MGYNGRYILDDEGNPKPEPDLMKWAEWFEDQQKKGHKNPRVIKQTRVKGYFVSTVFLALDYSFVGGMPMLFETMVWDRNDKDIYQDRHSTRQKAEVAHERIVNAIKYGHELK